MINLPAYEIDPVRGFLPSEDPLTQLPPAFIAWEEISAQVPALLTAGKIRQVLDKMPILDPVALENKRQLYRAFLLLSVMANAYIMGETEQASILPRNIAMPLWYVAQKVGLPPVFTYFSMMLYNWFRIDPSEPIDLDNLAISRSYQGSQDEHWFYLNMVVIEAKGGPAVKAMTEIQSAITSDDGVTIEQNLTEIIAVQEKMIATLKRLTEKCDPYIFYNRLRPILDAWKDPGVFYEGVSNQPQMWIAASAAQCSLFHAFDIAFGIDHQDQGGQFLRRMREYMPLKHRQFLAEFEAGPSLREYILHKKPDYSRLKELYNQSVELLDAFRKKHLEISVNYVVKQARKKETGVSGTSGTNVTRFLGQVRRETSEYIIK
jgi:indoleamine 2,3-dioxygenase